MERERLTRLVEEPGRMAREDLVGLKAMAERYPWFGGAHLLLAAGEHAAGEVLFDGTLATTSAHIPSRAVLFDLVERASEVINDQKAEAAVPPVEAPVPPVAAPGPVSAPPLLERVEETPPAPIILEASTLKEAAPVPPTPERVEDDVLEKQILEAALASAYDLTWQEQVPAQGLQEQEQDLGRAPAKAVGPNVEVAATVEVPQVHELVQPLVESPPTPAPSRITRASKLRFTEWLEASAPSEASAPVPKPEPAPPVAATDWLRTPSAQAEPPAPSPAPTEPPLDTKALIDRFIQQETPAPARKAEFYTPQQAAKRSLDDTAGLVTETLARIYEKQGNLVKAIDAYRKLALKYPEKSAYFAALQKELEERSNP